MPRRPRSARRRRWPIVLAVLLVALAAGWTFVWYQAAGKVEATINGWQEREAKVGRVYRCASQSVGGFPFGIEVHCDGVNAELKSNELALAISARNILLTAEIFEPTVLRGEFTGPLTVGELGQPAKWAASWRAARSEMHGLPLAPERAIVAVDQPVVDDVVQRKRLFQATRLTVDGRIADGSAQANPVLEVMLKVLAASAPGLHPAAGLPVDADITARLTGLKNFAPKPWPARLREIQEAGGHIEIIRARLQQGETIAVANGVLRLTPGGHLDGELRVTVANLERLLPALGLDKSPQAQAQMNQIGTALDRLAPGLGNVARRNAAPALVLGLTVIGQPTELEGQRAYLLPLRFSDGLVTLGPLPLGQTPPLF